MSKTLKRKVIFLILYFVFSIFNPVYAEEILTLEKCIELALKNNQTIKIAEQKIFSAQWKIKETFAGYLPQVNVSGTYLRKKKTEIEPSILQAMKSRSFSLAFAEEIYTGRLSLEQPIYTWGKISQANRQAALAYQIAREEYLKTKNEIVAQVKETFYRLLLAKQMVLISQEAVEVTAGHLRVTETFYKEGKVSKYDVSRAKVQLTNAQTNLIKAKNALKLAKETLFYLLNTKPDEVDVQGEMKYLPREIDLDTALEEALSNRPETKQMKLQEEIGNSLIKLTKASNKPTVILSGNYDWQNDQLSTKDWYDTWQALLVLNVPLFDGFSTRAKVKQSEANLEQIKLSRDLIIESVKLEVKQAVLNFQQAKESIEAQKENVETAKDNLRIAQERYKLGLMSNIEVRDAELTLTQAETNYYQAIADYLIALVKLEKAIGK